MPYSPLVAGCAIGCLTSLFGAVLSYSMFLRKNTERSRGPMMAIMIVSVTLVITGLAALVIGLFTGELMRAIETGVGVFIGFALSFAVLFFVYVRFGESPEQG